MADETGPAVQSGSFSIGGDLPVHRLGFGAMRITGKGVWGPPENHDEAIRVLRRCVELGINLIDTADSYGPDVSERLIAEALHPYPNGLVIATKAGFRRPGPDQWKEDGTPEHLRGRVEGSLQRLRLERIDLLQLHRIDPKVALEDQVGALARLQEEGKIRHIGFSEVSVEQIRGGATDRRRRLGTESVQPDEPEERGRARVLRGRGDRVHSVVPACHRRSGATRAARSPAPLAGSKPLRPRSRWRGCCTARR